MPRHSAEIAYTGDPQDFNSAIMDPAFFRKPGFFPGRPDRVLFKGGGGSGDEYTRFSEDEFEIRVDGETGAVNAYLKVEFTALASSSYGQGPNTKKGFVYQPVDLRNGEVLLADEYAKLEPKLVETLKAKANAFRKP